MDILEIDEVLKDDSFILLDEAEAINKATTILKQWRLDKNSNLSEEEGNSIMGATFEPMYVPKHSRASHLVDTRTFTRPKKRPTLHETISLSAEVPVNQTINLQIGGLVTSAKPIVPQLPFTLTSSMQKSLIGDTSPPNSICSTSLDLMNSDKMMLGSVNNNVDNGLITSSDFVHETFFLDNNNLQLSFNGYCMKDVAKDTAALIQMTADPGESDKKVTDSNETFELSKDKTIIPETENCKEKKIDGDSTFDLNSHTFLTDTSTDNIVNVEDVHLQFIPDSFIQSTPICKKKPKHDVFTFSPTNNDDLYEMRNEKPPTVVEKPQKEGLVDEKLLLKMSQTIDITENEEDDLLIDLRPKDNVPLEMLRPEERQSLTNFEEYEKSLMLLEDNKNEHEFDNMLENLDNFEMRRSNEKMRQSLDSIKKRHSLINYEKQQEELRKKVNSIDIEISNLSLETSSSSIGNKSKLLNRRSRLFDAVPDPQLMKTNIMNRTIDLTPIEPAAQPEKAESEERPERKNRDRFKTIKISRKSLNCNIPDADETSVDAKAMALEQDVKSNDESHIKPCKGPFRGLTRPKFTSGLMRPTQLNLNAQKSSSADDLLDSHPTRTEKFNIDKKCIPIGKLRSPLGVKAKSIHNLAVNNEGVLNGNRYGRLQHTGKTLGDINMRQNKPLGLKRPTSVVGYSMKRNEPESNTERFSPTDRTAATEVESQYKSEPRVVASRPSGLRPPGNFGTKSGLPRFSSIPRR